MTRVQEEHKELTDHLFNCCFANVLFKQKEVIISEIILKNHSCFIVNNKYQTTILIANEAVGGVTF